ncbi:cell division protein FtsA [Anaerosolibacter carboniphilus]|uniref:Cell division protein FtsA n=1 Tax=Anaerosolibacter carboniphilus TaxID=1417629 RepID=A0A841KME8_9FIRM|nr:cell division FtsA domain-containing protein [Anaerosolibacter carboniphilus]MBB6214616.1 cell division protein FtsA [Anaerosolibacter carboniphilus]
MSETTTVKINPHEIIFSLDIGTRNVVGIISKKDEDKHVILDVEVMEHPSRAMYDGQIHDIDKVAVIARKVKETLENRLGFELKQVAIAAAGRALKTYRVMVNRDIDISKEIDKGLIDSLEMEGIQKAQELIDQESHSQDHTYYCVGYTVVNYYLNDGVIMSLKGHRGNKIGAEVLATFLPHVVVNGLYTVMDKIGLEVINLTLEPIAAIQAAIPPKLRLLNLALVDIGAGTSDIALTQDGTIVAYAMASVAGDEITEALAKTYLLDFDMAENLKLELNKKDSHSFSDIVGIPYSLTTQEIIEKIDGVIESLAVEIANKIIEYNGKAPSAVFCIGGGSQIPQFTNHLAEKLGLPKERVVVRGTEIIENTVFRCEKLMGPEFITPIGIGIIAEKDREQDFLQVSVDGRNIKLFNSKQLLISDALILIGYNARKLISRSGKKLVFTLNGKEKVIPGVPGESAKIYLNGKISSLDTAIHHKDMIIIDPAIDGKDGAATLKEIVDTLKYVNFNQLEVKLYSKLTVNGKGQEMHYEIQEGDVIHYDEIERIEDLLHRFEMNPVQYHVFVNDVERELGYVLRNGDRIYTRERGLEMERQPVMETEEAEVAGDYFIQVNVNGQTVKVFKESGSFIFVDVFNYIDFDRTKSKGSLVLKLNGQRANYTDVIRDGDQIEVFWSEK